MKLQVPVIGSDGVELVEKRSLSADGGCGDELSSYAQFFRDHLPNYVWHAIMGHTAEDVVPYVVALREEMRKALEEV